MQRLSRRQLVLGAGSAALLAGCGWWPGQVRPPTQVRHVGLLMATSPSTAPLAEAFREGLRELGYVEGQNLAIEYRDALGGSDRLRENAANLVQVPVEIIVTGGAPATQAAVQATSTVPIVFAQIADPVGMGLVASLARPGGNLTGLTNIAKVLSAKRLELLKDTVPGLSSVAVLWDPTSSGAIEQLAETQEAAQLLGLRLLLLEVRRAEDLERAFEGASEHRTEAMAILGAPLMTASAARLADLAAQRRLPAIHPVRVFADAHGLMAYGADLRDQFRRAATYVDKILKGAKPADLPVEQPMRFDFVVNMRTARELGITFPHEVALQITEVIDQ